MGRVDATGHDAGSACANCGAALAGPYCSNCGQHGHVHRTMGAFLHDVLHGVFHFEGRFWATLPMLAWRPGELTRRYASGERVRFVSPMAVFLFSVFLMFAVVANIPFLEGAEKIGGDPDATGLRVRIAELRADKEKDAAEARAELEGATRRGDAEAAARARRSLDEARSELSPLLKTQRYLPPPGEGQVGGDAPDWLRDKLEHARANPQLVAYKIRSSAYKFSWALIPLSLPFVWLLFPFRRDVGMYDHAVFTTYSLGFMSLFAVALSLLGLAGLGGPAGVATVLVPPLHMYRQLKGAYGLTRAGAVWRTVWLLLFAALAAGTFVAALTWMGT